MTPDTLFSVRGKTALVTGGATGIGRMAAEALVRAGARVLIASRKGAACEAVAEELNASVADAVDALTAAGLSAEEAERQQPGPAGERFAEEPRDAPGRERNRPEAGDVPLERTAGGDVDELPEVVRPRFEIGGVRGVAALDEIEVRHGRERDRREQPRRLGPPAPRQRRTEDRREQGRHEADARRVVGERRADRERRDDERRAAAGAHVGEQPRER